MKDDSTRRAVNWFELDRLVDGQLQPAEYRELLRQIDKDPDGWRQCALAFLQHQALEREFQELAVLPDGSRDTSTAAASLPSSGQFGDDKGVDSKIELACYPRKLSRAVKLLCGTAAALVIGISAGVSMRPNSGIPGTVADSPGEISSLKLAADQARSEHNREGIDTLPGRSVPFRATYSRSSMDYLEQTECVVDQDPFLAPVRRPHSPLDRNE
jgi:hypothetical protein